MKILLIQPPIEDFYTTPIRLYPLGLTYTASVLQEFDCTVQILDCLTPLKRRKIPIPNDFMCLKPFLQSNPYLFKGYYRFGMSDEEIISQIKSFVPDMIGISSQYTAYYKNVHQLVSLIKAHLDLPIFIGGHHATVFSEKIKKRTPWIDFVLSGPAEMSVPDSFSTLPQFSSVPAEPMDWKELLPAHYLLNAQNYKIGKKNYMSLIASRGCPYKCDFCSVHSMFGPDIEYRDIDHILEEMRWNYLYKDIRLFNFEDDNLSFKKDRFGEFLKAVVKDPILKEIELTAMNGLCYPTLDEELLSLMKQAGFQRLNLSFVTHDAVLQKHHQRPRSSKKFEELLAIAKRLGFLVTVYIIIGLPDQTFAGAKESIDYLLEQDVLVGPSVFYIPAGSELYKHLNLPHEVRENWNLYRSSAFAVETCHLSRADIIELFSYCRQENLKKRDEKKSINMSQ